ncbi:MAG TPA: PQQ-dependent sugar dehydrogenase [Herpetosiphonaceae bacterium]|nr:PQQ-dependent sugar dehydrogenase [Herpetosiphonaceae bacterium]
MARQSTSMRSRAWRRCVIASLTGVMLAALALPRMMAMARDVVPGQRAGAAAAPLHRPPPSGFTDSLVASVSQPTDIAWTPDGLMLITTQPGYLRIYQNGTLIAQPALDLSGVVCDDVERGLLGVAVDPSFASNHFLYLYYTRNKHGGCATGESAANRPVNRASRFVLDGTAVNPASEVVLVDNILSVYGNHNAGDMAFGADGRLYISIGDGGAGGPADDLDKLAGKILRVNPDGTIPADNPWASQSGSRRCGDPAGVPAGGGPCKEIFAYGLRNPFRMAFQPGTSAFYINDVGYDAWEEIDLGARGANYGWPTREGPCDQWQANSCGAPPAGMTNPLVSYHHNTSTNLITDGCSSITGGAFVPSGIWPAAYEGSYLFSDYVCGKIFRRAPDGTLTEFVTDLGRSSIVTMAFGPHNGSQALYYTNYYGSNGSGQIRRIATSGNTNQPPNAVAGANVTHGPAPLAVTFSAAGSTDPNQDPLTYAWSFGDGASAPATSALAVSHTYAANGVYTATLTARDTHGGVSDPATVRIDVGNSPPTPIINTPAVGAEFAVGQRLTLSGSATDAEDGTLAGQSLRWQVLLHHVDETNPGNAHTHPLLAAASGASATLNAPAAEGLSATALSYLEIRLTATDSQGLTTLVTRTLNPRRVALTLRTMPFDGLTMLVNNRAVTTPHTLTSWENHQISVAPQVQYNGAGWWMCQGWGDASLCARTITTPHSATSYTMTYGPAHRILLPMLKR